MKKKGFTLVELLAVIAILAILVIVAMPNVLEKFNQAKQSSFENSVKSYLKTLNTEYFRTGSRIYSNVVPGAEKIDMDGEQLDYYIKLDSKGNIILLNITNGEYKIEATGTTSAPVKLEQIGNTVLIEEVNNGEEFVMDGNGNINGGSSQNSSQVVDNLNISINRNDFFRVGNTILSYDSRTQTPEQIYALALEKTWDMDVTYYKLSHTPADDRTQFFLEESVEGQVVNELLYGHNIEIYGRKFWVYSFFSDGEFSVPYLINTDDFTYSARDYTINFTKGLWFINVLDNRLSSHSYLRIKEAVFIGEEKVIDGMNCVKISNDTITKDNLIGKHVTMTYDGLSGSNNISEIITESLITERNSNIIIDNKFIVVPNDGIYADMNFLIGLFNLTVTTQ